MLAHVLGFPRIGRQRELKKALEGYWRGDIDAAALEAEATRLRREGWNIQRDAGLDLVTVGDHSLYDHVLDVTAMLGAVPPRFGAGGPVDLATYFRMARGDAATGAAAMEMTKWFDTNYHYIVPEFYSGQRFALSSGRLAEAVLDASAQGHAVKACLIGPVSYLALGASVDPGFSQWSHLEAIVDVYCEALAAIASQCRWIQIDEPILCTDLAKEAAAAFPTSYAKLRAAVGATPLMVATYFGHLGENLDIAARLPIDALHIDLVRAPTRLDGVLAVMSRSVALSLGVVDGRNIWRVEADRALSMLRRAIELRGEDGIMVASSCSLLHSPVDLEMETRLDPEIRRWMAFATQKCDEVAMLRDAVAGRAGDVAAQLEGNRQAWAARRAHPLLNDMEVRRRVADIRPEMLERRSPFAARKAVQSEGLDLPLLPTTTIGSFPQTGAIRQVRAAHRKGEMSEAAYNTFLREQIRDCVERQEALGLDVLVHGESERTDMVEYFGQQLDGYCFTEFGWVQSYGSRCVKPPIIFGDVGRPRPMTVEWITYAQSLTRRPMKGMLTGPVTMLCWSFVRDDVSREAVCKQLALAIREEVLDLERAGVCIIQIDEAALREGMPLRQAERDAYLAWAVDAFRLTAAGVADTTQIHSHMCYSEFNSIASWIARMDADVISIEASRSRMALLDAFERFAYPNDIGPGVYDIHSPRVPSEEEIVALLRKALQVIPAERLWVNPDCGLKTRGWPEATASLANMVAAARVLRQELAGA